MFKNNLKYIFLISSYSFFIITIIISINAVVPEEELPVLEQKNELIIKLENNFSRNKNSVYEILENNDEEFVNKKKENNEILSNKNPNQKFRLQFASFKEKRKSIETSHLIKDQLLSFPMDINLFVKKVAINDNQTFYRVVSENKYSFDKALSECQRLKKNKVQCIVIKD